jgi:hypothetical protein
MVTEVRIVPEAGGCIASLPLYMAVGTSAVHDFLISEICENGPIFDAEGLGPLCMLWSKSHVGIQVRTEGKVQRMEFNKSRSLIGHTIILTTGNNNVMTILFP